MSQLPLQRPVASKIRFIPGLLCTAAACVALSACVDAGGGGIAGGLFGGSGGGSGHTQPAYVNDDSAAASSASSSKPTCQSSHQGQSGQAQHASADCKKPAPPSAQ